MKFMVYPMERRKMFRGMIKTMSFARIIAGSFAIVICIGTFLLCLPVSSRSGEWTAVSEALFTATSATCVTGLVVFDTFTYWTLFGQLVILAMIQIGGLGLMSLVTLVFIISKRKIGLRERMLMQQASGKLEVSGIVKQVLRVLKGTFLMEGVGALLLCFKFVPQMGLERGIYYSVFHAISAFCNAGFDLNGGVQKFSSFTAYETDVYVSMILIFLIVLGGIGFLVWSDVVDHGFHFRDYSLHSKLVLFTTVILIVLGWAGYFIFEYNGNLAGYSMGDKLISSLFMSVTTRTAGFNTMNIGTLSDASCILSYLLMMIGGSPGSMAGGIKTATIAVIVLACISMSQGRTEINIMRKQLEIGLVKQAACILLTYLIGVLAATMLICHMEGMAMADVLFETVSAIATVGLTRGITTSLGLVSRGIIIFLMFAGRIGGMSMLMVFAEKKAEAPLKRPTEKILLG